MPRPPKTERGDEHQFAGTVRHFLSPFVKRSTEKCPSSVHTLRGNRRGQRISLIPEGIEKERWEKILVLTCWQQGRKGLTGTLSFRHLSIRQSRMSARSTKEFKTKEDILYLNYQRIFSLFQERMRIALAGIGDPAHQLRVTPETTLSLCNKFLDTVLLASPESHALSRRTLQSLFGVDQLYVSLLEEILHRWNTEGFFPKFIHFSALDRLQTAVQAPAAGDR